jgi:hypothetical protein
VNVGYWIFRGIDHRPVCANCPDGVLREAAQTHIAVCARTVNAAGRDSICRRLRRLYAYLAVLGRSSEHGRCRMGSRACAVAVDDDKTAESMHFVYEIPYSGICGLVGTHATIFDE